MLRPFPELRAARGCDAKPLAAQVEDHLVLEHPGGAQDGARPGPVVLEGVAPARGGPLAVQVRRGDPGGRLPLEHELHAGELAEALVQLRDFPAGALLLRPAAFVARAVALDRPAKVDVVVARHVDVGRTAVYHGVAHVRSDLAAVHLDRCEWNSVVASRGLERNVDDGAAVVAGVVAADDHASAPLREAQGEDVGVDVRLVGKKLLQQRGRAPAWRPDAEDAVGLLRVEQLVLVLVAAHVSRHRWVPLDAVAEPNLVPKPPAVDSGTLRVGLPIAAVATLACASATLAALDPLGRRAAGEVKRRVQVAATVPARLAGKGSDAAACVDDDRHSLRRRANQQVDVVVGKGVDVPVDARRLNVVDRVVQASAKG
mmetsp:Transcript_21458/g.62119  ORF Transcript_21458/g.62119 Transcript_21458/m.62119 type:complete len:372 (-) Transcript_21458:130-1245(-)